MNHRDEGNLKRRGGTKWRRGGGRVGGVEILVVVR